VPPRWRASILALAARRCWLSPPGRISGRAFDCPARDTLFLAAPVGYRGSIARWAGRILRARPGKITAEIHDYHDIRTPVLAATLARRAPG
jgi:superfamily II DNA or RNA helicase